ncbi:MAG: M13 family metallopeptidase [Nocardioidaceae bacterium]
MKSGIDRTHIDDGVRVADDLFRHVNGRWLASTEIPADRATAGAFVTLHDAAEANVRTIIERAASDADPDDPSDERSKIGTLYASFMDADTIESLGATPIADDLASLEDIGDVASFIATLGTLERTGTAGAFGLFVGPDEGNPERYVVNLLQGGLGLPDESYYREEHFEQVRDAYRTHVETMLSLAGVDAAAERAARIFDLESEIAGSHWDRVTCRDAQKTYNLRTWSDLTSMMPAFAWSTWAERAGVPQDALAEIVVHQPSYFEALDGLLDDAHLGAWVDWLRWQVVHSAAPYLSGAFVDENFAFYGRTLSGTAELRDRWKRGVGFVEMAMGEAVGKIYVDEHFPPASKQRMNALIDNLTEAYRESITDLEWMSATTKAKALHKLAAFTPKVGHPDKWRDYGELVVRPGDLVGNIRSALGFHMDYELGKIGRPVDRDEWYMTPQTVNAYYNPTMNEIVFPAAILQPPFFDAEADDAANYGAIGAVIGHEIGHGFDDQGSQYDGSGALRNWWTDEDRAAFDKLTADLVEQYDRLSPAGADGRNVNGALTIGENIGDLGGLSIAYKAYQLALDGEGAPVIDGLSGVQRFFFAWAQAWQSKVRDAEVVRRLTIDPHSPPEFRCNQVVRNIDAFYDAFGVAPEDELWLEPEKRVTIW